MINVNMCSIPFERMRYPSAGDYWEETSGYTHFRVADMRNPAYESLVLCHEFIEWMLIKRAGIKIEDIDAFDIAFEKARQPDNQDEPGNHPKAPYWKSHQIATAVERLIAAEMGIVWDEYDKEVQKVS